MCTSIIEIARAEGMAKRGDEWFPLSHAVVAYDHARHANLGDVITLDFMNASLEPGEISPFMPEPGGLSLSETEKLLRRIPRESPVLGAGLSGLAAEISNVEPLTRLCAALGL